MTDLLCLLMRESTSTFTAWFLFTPPILQNCQHPCAIANCLQIYQSYVKKNTSNSCKNKIGSIASNFHVGGNLGTSCRMGEDSVLA